MHEILQIIGNPATKDQKIEEAVLGAKLTLDEKSEIIYQIVKSGRTRMLDSKFVNQLWKT